jgi:vacuolar-type H+-ATPase subunit H
MDIIEEIRKAEEKAEDLKREAEKQGQQILEKEREKGEG